MKLETNDKFTISYKAKTHNGKKLDKPKIFRFELESQCKICGINNFSLKERMKGILFRENN